MKQLLITICVILSSLVYAQKINPKVKAAIERQKIAGYVVKEGSQKGIFTFINTQTVLSDDEIKAVAKRVEEDLLIKVVVSNTDAGDPKSLVRASGGALGVVIVYDDTTPSLMVAPDDGWAVVNIKKMEEFPSETAKKKFFAKRCRGQLLRAFSAVAGGFFSSYPGNIMDATSLSEIEVLEEGIPHDKVISAQKFLKSRGYAPLIRIPYAKACREGWAPAPTNDVQKAIWDKVHATPKNPMKIEFDPKKGR